MAVQAQYPSNVLLLNRNVQEPKDKKDYSLQPQLGGYLDQSHMLFNNNGESNNPRKRGRDFSSGVPINSFSSQPLHPQLVDLSQLHSHQHSNVVSTGLRLAFGDQQQQQQLQQQNQQHNNYSNSSSLLLSLLSEDAANQIKQQRDEIDQFLQTQGEHLRRALADKRQMHYRALLSAADESVSRRFREKEAEAEKASRRNAELEDRAAQLSLEAQVWQAKAREQEATAVYLQAQLQHAIMNGGCAQDYMRDDGLTCAADANNADDAESVYVDPDRVVSASGPICKACQKRVASVVLLPCRHLCVCMKCDGLLQACPLCLTIRNSSVEVFLS